MNKHAEIIQGGASSIVVRIVDDSTGDPLDLTGVAEVTTCFQNTDGTELTLSLTGGSITVLSDVLGKLRLSLSSAETAAMEVVELATMEISLTFVGDPVKVQIPRAYSVLQTVC